jgi:hypothetical protein
MAFITVSQIDLYTPSQNHQRELCTADWFYAS